MKIFDKKQANGFLVILIYFILTKIPFHAIIFSLLAPNVNTISTPISVVLTLAYQILLMCIIMMIYAKDLKKDFKDFIKNAESYFKKYAKYWLIGVGVMMISNLILQSITGGIAGNEEAIREQFTATPFYVFVATVIYAPIVEELVFRKSIRGLIKNDKLFILVSGLVFGALHIVSSYTGPLDLLYIIPYSSLGVAFAYVLTKKDNIFITISFHMMHNGILIALQFLLMFFS